MEVYDNIPHISIDDIKSIQVIDNSDGNIQPREMCLNCTTTVQLVQLCLQNKELGDGTRTHKCGLLWRDTCTVKTYFSFAGDYCISCGNFIVYTDEDQSDGIGRHVCFEVHDTCGAGDNGQYDVCPFLH